ncbi:MAG TPA: LuxR family transcriptional regulator [Hyphomicrobiaceae bacterium]|nr:LuxR family transcriptional regulator [Hyphomicrobiaceae bacterium]
MGKTAEAERIAAGAAFLGRIATGKVPALIAEFEVLVQEFGVEVTAGGCWAGLGKDRQYRFFFNNWPAEWNRYYAETGFFDRDFIVAAARQSVAAFLWNERQPALFDQVAAQEFLDVNQQRWVDGFVVPIRGPGGFEGLISLAARSPLHFTPGERAVLEAVSRALHERCRLEIGLGATMPGSEPLTDRELNVMRWVATGKTDAKVGTLLHISRATVHFHVEAVKRKLGVHSRVQAVAILVLHGLI